MAKFQALLFSLFSFSFCVTFGIMVRAVEEDRKVYIVYMGSLPEEEYSPASHHLSLLQEVAADSSTDLLLRSYTRSFNGFAANLTDDESRKLAAKKGVVSVFPSGTFHVQTTRSWDFMGLQEEKIRGDPGMESNIVIGVVDTGIWPESESFSDEGFGPAPKKWKGVCNGGQNFTCNNKLIGARYYSSSGASGSARDDEGHGSHTASTAAGNKVKDVSFYGFARGTARGGVPSARIAAYKVCTADGGCQGADILAAFDDAIADGVDIITVSLGRLFALSDFTTDEISIGSFHAMEKGILTVNSAGNSGPGQESVSSVAPWLFSVAASTTDRRIIDKVVLGSGKTLIGSSVNSFTLNGTKFPVVYGLNVSRKCSEFQARMCDHGCVDRNLVKGKIVLCDAYGSIEAQAAGAVGAIVLTSQPDNIPIVVPFPTLSLTSDNYDSVKSYVLSTPIPEANILKSEVTKDSSAPIVASFSSRGPNPVIPDILKPDVSAPGVNILAAYIPVVSPSYGDDKRRVNYNLLSGTSMSCPHVAGVAALVKTFHPYWSPSAIKSAIMTTAWPMNATKNVDGEVAYGSGHVNPSSALHPGLVYEASKTDYVKMLCGIGYDSEKIRKLSGDNSSCPGKAEMKLPKDLNYPSMAFKVHPNNSFTVQFHRTVTNVGFANSTYAAKVIPNPKLNVKVVPEVLSFRSLYEKKSFKVSVTGESLHKYETFVSTTLVWTDGKHSVRSPIVVHTGTFF